MLNFKSFLKESASKTISLSKKLRTILPDMQTQEKKDCTILKKTYKNNNDDLHQLAIDFEKLRSFLGKQDGFRIDDKPLCISLTKKNLSIIAIRDMDRRRITITIVEKLE